MADITTWRDHRARPARMERWAIIRAGGDGTRLRDLTRRIAGDDRPKQFCPLLGEETHLAVLPVRGVDWSDLGHPERVLACRGTMVAPWAEIALPRRLARAVAV